MKDQLIILLEKFLRKTATPEETAKLISLFDSHESHALLDSYYEEIWSGEQADVPTEVEERMLANLKEKIANKPKPVKRVRLSIRLSRVAAAILIPALMLSTLFLFFDSRSYKDSQDMVMSVDVGQKANVQLPDGTLVWLNSASSLQYDNSYNRKDRVVTLKGEAYFDVKKDSRRPFVVKAEDEITVEALGTSFNIKSYPEDRYVTTTLIEGSVRVSNPFGSEILKPNEQLVITQDRGFAKSRMNDAERLVGWRNNQLAFEKETLGEIAKTLERMYNIDVVFSSEEIKNIRFSGKIKNNNLESILQLISVVSPILYSIEDSTVYIRENPKEIHMYKKIQ